MIKATTVHLPILLRSSGERSSRWCSYSSSSAEGCPRSASSLAFRGIVQYREREQPASKELGAKSGLICLRHPLAGPSSSSASHPNNIACFHRAGGEWVWNCEPTFSARLRNLHGRFKGRTDSASGLDAWGSSITPIRRVKCWKGNQLENIGSCQGSHVAWLHLYWEALQAPPPPFEMKDRNMHCKGCCVDSTF